MITAEDVELQSTRDTADVLRIYKVVRAIRNRGHFAARLDPLGRSLGPLKEGYELMESTVPEDGADIAKLLNGFPNDLYLRGRKVNVGQYLGLHDPSPEKRFFLGNECKSLDPDGRRQWWTVESSQPASARCTAAPSARSLTTSRACTRRTGSGDSSRDTCETTEASRQPVRLS